MPTRTLKFAAAALLATFCWLAALVPASAQSGVPGDVAKFEILPGWRTEKGTYMTALRIQLRPGWKTYWRAPGDAGIPPQFDWSGSRNLKAVKFHWPVPDVFNVNGMRSLGYKHELVLPIELTPRRPGKEINLRARVALGVCDDICMPVQVRLSADLAGEGVSNPRIRAAIASLPVTPGEAGLRAVHCRIEPISDGLRLTATMDLPRIAADEVAVLELPDQSIWVSEAVTRRQGRTLTAVADIVPPGSSPFVLDRSQVRITVLGEGRGVDIQGCTG